MRLPGHYVTRTERFTASAANLEAECVEKQLAGLEWQLMRGLALDVYPEFTTSSGKTGYLVKTLGLADCPPYRVFVVMTGDHTCEFADISLAVVGAIDN